MQELASVSLVSKFIDQQLTTQNKLDFYLLAVDNAKVPCVTALHPSIAMYDHEQLGFYSS